MDKLFTARYELGPLTEDQIKLVQSTRAPLAVYEHLRTCKYEMNTREDVRNKLAADLTAKCRNLDSIVQDKTTLENTCSILFQEKAQLEARIRSYQDTIKETAERPSWCFSWQNITKMKNINRRRHLRECRICRVQYNCQYDRSEFLVSDALGEDEVIEYRELESKAAQLKWQIKENQSQQTKLRADVLAEHDTAVKVADIVCRDFIETQLHLTKDKNVVVMVGDIRFTCQELGHSLGHSLGQALLNLK